MRYPYNEEIILAGHLEPGLYITITIIDMHNDLIINLADSTCVESINIPGVYLFNTSNILDTIDEPTNLLYKMSDGTNNFYGKFVYGNSNSNIIEVDGTPVTLDDFSTDTLSLEMKLDTIQSIVELLENYDDTSVKDLLNSLETLAPDERTKLMSLINYDDNNLKNLINSLQTLTEIEHNKLMSLNNYDDLNISNKIDDVKSLVNNIHTNINTTNTNLTVVKNIVEGLPILSDIKQEMVNVQYGKLEITNNQLSIWDKEGNLLTIFDLFDNNNNPTMNAVYRREVVL